MASISSEGSADSQNPFMGQEVIAVITYDVHYFREALEQIRGILDMRREKSEKWHLMIHERLGDALKILHSVLEKYPALRSPEILLSASTFIHHLKGNGFDDSKADHQYLFSSLDQLALAFSSRLSDCLMGDLDTNILVTTLQLKKAKPPDEIIEETLEGEAYSNYEMIKNDISGQLDAFLNFEQGVEFALNKAKIWSKYVKDILTYIEKRCLLEMEYTQSLNKFSQLMKSLINEETYMEFQSVCCTTVDFDSENSNLCQTACRQILLNMFLKPLSDRRTEHEKERRLLKVEWLQEVGRMQYMLRKGDVNIQFHRSSDQENWEGVTQMKEFDAETSFNVLSECQNRFVERTNEILQKIRILLLESDIILRTVTIAFVKFQNSLYTPASNQFQDLSENSHVYEPESQYLQSIKYLLPPEAVNINSFTFENFCQGFEEMIHQGRQSIESIECDDLYHGFKEENVYSDTDSNTSVSSSHDAETSLYTTIQSRTSLQELICEMDSSNNNGFGFVSYLSSHRYSLSKAAKTHSFRKLKTPSRCRECDSYVYFQGVECNECGLACHKKCLGTLAIQCGHKRLPRKMTTFGVDLAQHLGETATTIPSIVSKCIDEIESRGHLVKGIYRISGVKSKVEKLCQAFENGAELVDLSDIHPNVIANVLKLYLRQLPEPLLTFHLYPDFIRFAKDYISNSSADVNEAKEEIKKVLKKLSWQHYFTLELLMLHLKRISRDVEANKMSPSNLGIVFGPTLLRTTEGNDTSNCLVDTIHQTRVIEFLIFYADEIFISQEIVPSKETT